MYQNMSPGSIGYEPNSFRTEQEKELQRYYNRVPIDHIRIIKNLKAYDPASRFAWKQDALLMFNTCNCGWLLSNTRRPLMIPPQARNRETQHHGYPQHQGWAQPHTGMERTRSMPMGAMHERGQDNSMLTGNSTLTGNKMLTGD